MAVKIPSKVKCLSHKVSFKSKLNSYLLCVICFTNLAQTVCSGGDDFQLPGDTSHKHTPGAAGD